MLSTQKPLWEVYIVQSTNGALYTGITTNLERRFREHAGKKKGARFFRTSAPVQVVFREAHRNRSTATKREIEIKRFSRKEKLSLIAQGKL